MLDNIGVVLDKVAGPNLFFKLQIVFHPDQRCQRHTLTVHPFNARSDQNEMSPCNISGN